MNLREAALRITTLAAAMELSIHAAMDAGGAVLEEQAKAVMGTYNYGWTPLAASTVARKGADTPLVETGELRDSIERTVVGKSVFVGSDNDKAVWHELGASRIPARSFLAETASRRGAEAVGVVAGDLIGRHLLNNAG